MMTNGPHSARKLPRPPASSDSAPVMWAPGCAGPIHRAASAGGARFAAGGEPSAAAVSGMAAPGGAISEAVAVSGTEASGRAASRAAVPEAAVPEAAVSAAMASEAAGAVAAGFAAFSAVFFLALPSPLLPATPAVFFVAFLATFFVAFLAVFFATFLTAFFAVALTPMRATDPGVSSPGLRAASPMVLSSIIAPDLPVDGRFDGGGLPGPSAIGRRIGGAGAERTKGRRRLHRAGCYHAGSSRHIMRAPSRGCRRRGSRSIAPARWTSRRLP